MSLTASRSAAVALGVAARRRDQQEGVRPLDTAMDVYRPESWRLGQHRLGCLESPLEGLLTAVGYPQFSEAAIYLLMLLVLLVRPRGLFGERIQRFE